MSLPPLANVLALSTPDPAELVLARERMEAAEGFDPPWQPAPDCLVAVGRLPGSAEDPDDVRDAGLVFAEGREAVTAAGRGWSSVSSLIAEQPDRLGALPGDFSLLHVDRRGRATAVRSAAGLVPFYFAGGGDRWVVSTTLDHMLRFHPDELELDPLPNAAWSSGSGAAPYGRSLLRAVRVLGRGEFVRLDVATPAPRRWWTPRQGTVPRESPDHAERLRGALLGTLGRELDPGGGNLLALSGGVDSAAVGALAAGLLGLEVDTLTVLPDDEASRTRDVGYIDALDRAVGLHHRTELPMDGKRRLELLDEPAVPFHVLQPYLGMLRGVVAEQRVSVLFGGEFADHTVGSQVTLPDWARHTSLAGLWKSRRRLPTGRSDLKRWVYDRLGRILRRPTIPWPSELPQLVRPELRAEYGEWFRERRRAAASDDGPMPYLAMLLEREGFLGMNWEICSALGVRRCYPFVSREVLELAFECHPAELVGPGTKRLLRAALRGDVPPVNLERPDKGRPGLPGGYEPRRWTGDIPSALDAILADGWPPNDHIPYWDVFRTRQLVAFARAVERSRLQRRSVHRTER